MYQNSTASNKINGIQEKNIIVTNSWSIQTLMKKMLPVNLRKQMFYRFKYQNDSIFLESSNNQKPNSQYELSDFPMAFCYNCVSCFPEALKREIKIVVMQRDVFDYGQKATIISQLDIWDSRDFDAKKKLKKHATNFFSQVYS